MKQWSRRKEFLPAVVALSLGSVLYWQARLWLTKPVMLEAPHYLVYRRGLGNGHELQFADLKIVPPGSLAQVPPGAVTDQDLGSLRGSTLIASVEQGAPVTFNQLNLRGDAVRFGRRIPVGLRAYPLPVSDSLRIQASDYVDIVSVPARPGAMPTTLAEGVMVLGVQKNETSSEALVALSPDEVELVEKGLRTGTLKLALRNPTDVPRQRGPKRRPATPRSARKAVQIWSEENG